MTEKLKELKSYITPLEEMVCQGKASANELKNLMNACYILSKQNSEGTQRLAKSYAERLRDATGADVYQANPESREIVENAARLLEDI